MVHKPKHKVHSFRGLLSDGGQDEINLERQNVNIAYRIVKFEAFPNLPGTTDWESTLQVFREEQTTVSTTTATVDFMNTDLLGAVYYPDSADLRYNAGSTTVVFDNILFSRNIYVTHTNTGGSDSINYYIEIEEVPVGAATLMQIKLGSARRLIGAKMGA